MKLFHRLLITVLFAFGFFAGCASNDSEIQTEQDHVQDQEDSGVSPADSTSESNVFSGTGIVMNITPSKTFIVIEHQDIAGFMGAMTMPFAINEQKVLESVAVGDSIDFELTVSGSETYLSMISAAQR